MSSLADGDRRRKDDIAFEALGTVDEAQVTLGECRCLVSDVRIDGTSKLRRWGARSGPALKREIRRMRSDIAQIQNDLLLAGGTLSHTPALGTPDGIPLLGQKDVRKIEKTFEYWRERVTIEPRFYIAGDTRIGASFDRARTVVRRAERRVVRLLRERGNMLQKPVSKYLNVLSDLCFLWARYSDAAFPRNDGGID